MLFYLKLLVDSMLICAIKWKKIINFSNNIAYIEKKIDML